MEILHGFILTRQWRDSSTGVELEIWLSTDTGPLRFVVQGQRGVFFLPGGDSAQALAGLPVKYHPDEVREVQLQDFSGQQVKAWYFNSHRALRQCRDQLLQGQWQPLEADINPVERFLMERFVTGSMALTGQSQNLRDFAQIMNQGSAEDLNM